MVAEDHPDWQRELARGILGGLERCFGDGLGT
jgi:hypothetical protein